MRTIYRVVLLTVLATFASGADGLLEFRSGQARRIRPQREEKASGRAQGRVSWWRSGRYARHSAGIHEKAISRRPMLRKRRRPSKAKRRLPASRTKRLPRSSRRSPNPSRSVRRSRGRSRSRHRLPCSRRSSSSRPSRPAAGTQQQPVALAGARANEHCVRRGRPRRNPAPSQR